MHSYWVPEHVVSRKGCEACRGCRFADYNDLVVQSEFESFLPGRPPYALTLPTDPPIEMILCATPPL